MREDNGNNILNDIIKSESFKLALLVGMVFPVIAWIIEFVRNKITVSFTGLVEIHTYSPLLFITDIAPFVIVIGAYLLDKHRISTDNEFVTQISERDARMNAMADFAKKIGEGNYEAELSVSADQDILAESLAIMRDNLLQSSKKDSEQSWIAEGKETISHILRQYNKIDELSAHIIQTLIHYTKLVQGAIFIYNEETKTLVCTSTYAYNRQKFKRSEYKLGYGLIGQCAYEMD